MRCPINKPGWRTSYSHWITAMKMTRRSCPPLSISPASTHPTHNQTLVKSQSKLIRKRSVLIVAYCALPGHENLEVLTMLESLDVLAWGLQWSCAVLYQASRTVCVSGVIAPTPPMPRTQRFGALKLLISLNYWQCPKLGMVPSWSCQLIAGTSM